MVGKEKEMVMSENDNLVERLIKKKVIKTPLVEQILRAVDRGNFMPADTPKEMRYFDSPQQIGYGATISAPHMHAWALVYIYIYIYRNY